MTALALLALAGGCAKRAPEPASPPLEAPYVGGGHVLLYVSDVAEAMAAAASAGFDPAPGTAGDAPGNAMIHLDNGWFIELVAPTDFPAYVYALAWFSPALGDRLDLWATAGPGDLFDWSVDVSDIEAARDVAIANGVPFSKIRDFDREQPNGELTSWQLALPVEGELPFFKSPYTNHVDVRGHMQHPNGARSLAGFTLRVADLNAERERLARTLAIAPRDAQTFCLRDVELRLEQSDRRGLQDLRVASTGEVGPMPLAEGEVELVPSEARPCLTPSAGGPDSGEGG